MSLKACVGNELNVENARQILPPLERAINGKSWDGKEIVLRAVVRFAELASPLFEQDPKVLPQIQKVIIRFSYNFVSSLIVEDYHSRGETQEHHV